MVFLLLCTYTLGQDGYYRPYLEFLQAAGLMERRYVTPCDLDHTLEQLENALVSERPLTTAEREALANLRMLLEKSPDFSVILEPRGYYGNERHDRAGYLDTRLGGTILPGITYGQGMTIRYGIEIDSAGPRSWKDRVQAYLTEGSLSYGRDRFGFTVGRRNMSMGPGTVYGLLLAPAVEGYDGCLFEWDGNYYDFTSSVVLLDALPRFLATHRLGLRLRGVTIGFSESVLWTEDVEPLYLNALLPYYLAQWGTGRDDNIMWAFDASFRYAGITPYAELLIDDYQYEEPSGFNDYPHKLAWIVGCRGILFERWLGNVEYTFVDKWVYTQELPQNAYVDDGRCLGYPAGNDADRVAVELRYYAHRRVIPWCAITGTRKGEGSLFIPYESELGPVDPPFPSGIVEKRLGWTIGLNVRPGERLQLELRGGQEKVTNAAHQPGANATSTSFAAGVRGFF